MAFKFVVLSALLAVASAGVLQPVTYAHVANPAVDAVASSHQNVVRTFDGTVSQYSKTIETPYSSVHKSDSRVSNNVYTPAIAKTVAYAAPAVAKTVTYAAPAPVYHHEVPVAKAVSYAAPVPTPALYTHAAPIVSKTVYAPAHAHAVVAAPAVAKTVTYAAPAPVYHHEVPVAKTVTYAAPAPVYHHEVPVAKAVSYAAPAVAKTVSYAAPAPVYHHAAPVATTNYNHGSAATTYTHNAPGLSGYGSSQTVHYSPAETASHMSFDGFGTHWGW